MKEKRRKIKKRLNTAILTLALSIGFLTQVLAVEADAAANWKTAYKEVLKNPEVDNYGDISYLKMYFRSDCKFDRYFVTDINNDKIPELFLYSTTMKLSAVFTYDNGKARYLSYNNYYKINKAKKLLIVQGHWHGAGGSGEYEYYVYKMAKKELKYILYMDHLPNRYTVNSKESATSEAYDKAYGKYIEGGKKFSSFKKYKLSNMEGLKAQ